MNSTRLFAASQRAAAFLALCVVQAILPEANAQPTLVSTVPADGATGVSPTAPVVFTFSTAMNTSVTFPSVTDHASGNPLIGLPSWSSDMKTLTYRPLPSWPSPNKQIDWVMYGFDASFTPLAGSTTGSFTTGGGGGGTGSGTNKITTFSVGRIDYYDQTSTAAPFPDHDLSYGFTAGTTLASNRTATSISLTLASGGTTNLSQNPISPESYYFVDGGTNLAPIDAKYPGGAYLFNVQAATSNQQVTVTLPASSAQPPAPHVSNFTAAQSVDPTKPFTLTWDAYAGGTGGDFISVDIYTNFMSPNLGTTGALSGTATSIVIPANTLPPNRFLDSCRLTFYRYVATSNSSYATFGFRATSTRFFLTTTGGSATSPIVLTNSAGAPDGNFSFDVDSSAGQALVIEYSTTLAPGSWTTLLSTNSPGRAHVTDPLAGTAKSRFYRARTGP